MRDYIDKMFEETKMRNRNAEKLFSEFVAEDDRKREDAKNFVPRVCVKEYASGLFLEFDNVCAPVRLIESICITNIGGPPIIRYEYMYGKIAYKAKRAIIEINLQSGNTHKISCDRHVQDLLHEALLLAWKGEKL